MNSLQEGVECEPQPEGKPPPKGEGGCEPPPNGEGAEQPPPKEEEGGPNHRHTARWRETIVNVIFFAKKEERRRHSRKAKESSTQK